MTRPGIHDLPAPLTSTAGAGVAGVTCYANDLVRSLSQGGSIRTWALDPANRLATMTSTGLGATALTNHYGDPGTDSPTWTVDTAADATVSTRRYVGGLAGFLAEITTTAAGVSASTVELTGLHGDVLRTSTPTATGSPDGLGNDTDEYGIVHDSTGAITTGPRYNWLGGKQRATDTGTTGLTLMGVRLYTPTTGRFLSTDPIYGGNANTYGYPADPVDRFDLSGRFTYCWLFAFLCRGPDALPVFRHLTPKAVSRTARRFCSANAIGGFTASAYENGSYALRAAFKWGAKLGFRIHPAGLAASGLVEVGCVASFGWGNF